MARGPDVPTGGQKTEIEPLLDSIRAVVALEAPHLDRLLAEFAQEARFGRGWLDSSLGRIGKGEPILEIGAGLMLLSCQLVKEGYAVTALEPISEGFSHFSELQALVLRFAEAEGIAPKIVATPVEELEITDAFALAYSVNVMEHVGSVALALRKVGRAIRPGAEYRFVCANYSFPYEPHFDIPTLFSKKATERFFGAWIRGNPKVADPAGLWRSLNWITVSEVLRNARLIPGMSVRLDRKMFRIALERAIYDKEFSARRALWVRFLARALVGLGLHRLTEYLPAHCHPIIDCTMTRSPTGGYDAQAA